MHFNINSLLPKIDELRCITRLSNAGAIGISELKLDKSTTHSEIPMDNYDLLDFGKYRNSAWIACYIRHDLSCTQKNLFPNDIENVFFGISLPKTETITVGIVCRPLDLINFIKTLNEIYLIPLMLKIFSIFLYLKSSLKNLLNLQE